MSEVLSLEWNEWLVTAGLDWGGVSREFFQLLSECCFDSSNGLFRKFKDSAQALVMAAAPC